MAEGLLNGLASSTYFAQSAGTEETHVRPLALKTMTAIDIDISHHFSKTLDQFLDTEFDYVITVCDNANEACPYFKRGKNRLHWSFPDPSKATGTEEEQLAVYATVRDSIRERIEKELL
ncbi:protein-tyrosine phosphatase, low molecular weight [Obelidium mucronatum]|nr:protein-tyrosine phosphatase, low molecular weight [Obelidium mucronatum]